jgi:hypothetical protein
MNIIKNKNREFVLSMTDCEALDMIARLAGQIEYAKHFGHSSKMEAISEVDANDPTKGFPSVIITVVNKGKE